MARRGGVVRSEDGRYYRCWECDEEFAVAATEERVMAGPVLYCPLCGSVGVEPVEGHPSVLALWTRALHVAPVH
jgi:DNA-directed RNA polymerase subunit RPC12/RpoP